MAIATKRSVTAKPGKNAPAGKGAVRTTAKPSIRQEDETFPAPQPSAAPAAVNPAAALVDTQVRTLADLCEALDKKCLELVEEVAAAQAASALSEPAIAKLNEMLAEERKLRAALEKEVGDIRRAHERELSDARREKAALEREIAAMRLVLERSTRPTAVSREKAPASRPAPTAVAAAPIKAAAFGRTNGEHAARLLPLLQASLASGEITVVHDTNRALARFRTAAMIDSIEGTREAPICVGWLLSRADLQADPLMFLIDDVGLLGWTDANIDRMDVSSAYRNTKSRSGFKAALSRVPVGRLRGVVAVHDADGEEAVFFEAARKLIPKSLLS